MSKKKLQYDKLNFRIKRSATEYADTFDPEGSGYDTVTAKQFGIEPDSLGKYPSRVPETGQILKGMKHETIDKTLEAERKLGFEISKGPDGKYYSQKKEPENNLFDFATQAYDVVSEAIKDVIFPSEPKTLSKKELEEFEKYRSAEMAKVEEGKRELSEYEEQQPIMLSEAAEGVKEFATKPLEQAGGILSEAGERFEEAFTPKGPESIGEGISNLLGGTALAIEAPIAATLGYLNQVVEPIATAAAETDIGKAIDQTALAQNINQFLNQPASYTMGVAEEYLGLEIPPEGALQLADIISQLGLFKAGESLLFKKPPKAPYGELKISPKRLKELKSEAKDVKTGEVPTKQGKSVVEETTGPVKEGIKKPKGPDQKVMSEGDLNTVKENTLAELRKGTTIEEAKLGEYGKMPTTEVMAKLKEYDALDYAKKLAERVSKGDKAKNKAMQAPWKNR